MHTGVKVESCIKNYDDQREIRKKWITETLLKKLQRIEQVDFHIGDDVAVRFVNLQQKTNEGLDDIGMSHLWERKTCTT